LSLDFEYLHFSTIQFPPWGIEGASNNKQQTTNNKQQTTNNKQQTKKTD
jgi:hypothetical protein